MTLRSLLILLCLCSPLACLAGEGEESLGLVPRPWKISSSIGPGLPIQPGTYLSLSPDNAETRLLAAQMRQAFGFKGSWPAGKREGGISLKLDASLKDLGPEGYRLKIVQGVMEIQAQTAAGAFYAIQTLRQLLPPRLLGGATDGEARILPALEIEDRPRFRRRGFMLDVGRHFFPKQEILRVLDLLALHKFNRFHWHLTEDQGWRIEIKKYPLLTRTGGWRKEEKGLYGGFYTQKELREVVAYAAERHITVIPEIEMPGHSSAALTSYPWLGCTGGPYKVQTEWGVFDDVFCPGKESTFTFIKDVLDEVMDIFPSAEIHLGGDECPKERWQAHDLCQRRMKEQGLKDEKALQSYFMKRVSGILAARGRRLIGWDEICEGGLAPDAIVQWWINAPPVVEAARQGHEIITSNFVDVYLDQMHTGVSDRHLYSFSPYPKGLPAALRGNITGVEAPLWTEGVPTRAELDFQVFPRLCALSENLWLDEKSKDYESFMSRMYLHRLRLDALGVGYRDLGTRVGDWKPSEVSRKWKPFQWQLNAGAKKAGAYRATLEYDRGPSNLLIRSMSVLSGARTLKQVTATAIAGDWIWQPELNFDLSDKDLSEPLTLKISARGEKGQQSYGRVFLKCLP